MRDVLSFSTASVAGLLTAAAMTAMTLGVAACGDKVGPTDQAVRSYLDRSGSGPGPGAGDGAVAGDAGAAGQNTANGDGSAATTVLAARRIAVTVDKAEGLPDLDAGPGESDPYVILEYEGQRHRSSVVEGNLAPVWGDTFILEVVPGGVLTVKLMDEDALSSDEQFGTVSEALPALGVGETKPLVLTFRGGEGGKLSLTLTGMARP